MPDGGVLRLETSCTWISDAQRDVLGPGATTEYVCLAIDDTGAGMDEATRQRAFEPFFTTKPIGKGTGLGLATVYGLVKQHGGFVQIDSAPGAGTRLRVYFPVAEEATRRRASGSHRSEEHTSELQSPDHLVCRLLLEKKKKKKQANNKK